MSSGPMGDRFTYAGRYARQALQRARQRRPMLAAPYRPDPSSWPADRATMAWLGHATVLMRLDGVWILTDPVLRSRVGVNLGPATIGPRRLVRPALRPHDLPPIDLVLLSHAHMDHTDLATLRRLPRSATAVVHRQNGDLARRFRQVIELDWGESTTVAGHRIEATPARHWGARVIKDTHRGFGGFLVESPRHAVLFAGDTAYTDQLTALGERRPIDAAILPIGAYDPWVHNHANPEQAWRMFRDLGAEYFLPVHHSTFRLSREPADEPLRRLIDAAGPDAWRVVGREIGETWTLPG